MNRMNEHVRRLLLGLGLDCTDGEMRITKGPNFHLLGGSAPTHERMQATCMRFNEELARRGLARQLYRAEDCPNRERISRAVGEARAARRGVWGLRAGSRRR